MIERDTKISAGADDGIAVTCAVRVWHACTGLAKTGRVGTVDHVGEVNEVRKSFRPVFMRMAGGVFRDVIVLPPLRRPIVIMLG